MSHTKEKEGENFSPLDFDLVKDYLTINYETKRIWLHIKNTTEDKWAMEELVVQVTDGYKETQWFKDDRWDYIHDDINKLEPADWVRSLIFKLSSEVFNHYEPKWEYAEHYVPEVLMDMLRDVVWDKIDWKWLALALLRDNNEKVIAILNEKMEVTDE